MADYAASQLITAEELERLEIPGKSTELVRGQLVVREPPSARHGSVAARLTCMLGEHVYRNDLGVLFTEAGFKIQSSPDTVRAPDVAFVARQRADGLPPTGYAPFAPDLAIEIVSPGDRPGEVLTKVGEWLEAGATLVWVIDPPRAQARVYGADGDVKIVSTDGVLVGEPVLPGFTCPLAEVLR